MRKIPRCMSTQHPDNVHSPFFAENSVLGGEDEVKETYYAFSHLGCDEQMWDCEGKEVDNFVVKKLLAGYGQFFSENRLGEDLFLTLRVPNPTVEKAEAKILVETLESIPRSFDAAEVFCKSGTPPIFEVILPMTSSHLCLDRIYHYYSDFVVAKQHKPVRPGDITVAEWVGGFNPEKINVIPLFEDIEFMVNSDKITREYIRGKDIGQQRVFFARSDPALNYGLVSAVLLNKIGLWKMHLLSEETGVRFYPIIGVGSAPFRGNFMPGTGARVAEEYPSVHTFTIQSSFKYDNPPEQVRACIEELKERKTGRPMQLDCESALGVVKKYSEEYRRQVISLAPTINKVAKHVPGRRKRKLHIGLFGYSRCVGNACLPRAIPFTAALYSVGLPPELLGLNALDGKDLEFVSEAYINFEKDIRDALRYFNPESGLAPDGLCEKLKGIGIEAVRDKEHAGIAGDIAEAVRENRLADIEGQILKAASIRKFLG
jgi:phosphoenolpyruvate carboxylase